MVLNAVEKYHLTLMTVLNMLLMVLFSLTSYRACPKAVVIVSWDFSESEKYVQMGATLGTSTTQIEIC